MREYRSVCIKDTIGNNIKLIISPKTVYFDNVLKILLVSCFFVHKFLLVRVGRKCSPGGKNVIRFQNYNHLSTIKQTTIFASAKKKRVFCPSYVIL